MSDKNAVFKSFDEDERLVYGEVYAPNIPDSDGDYMDEATIKKMAHDFLRTQKLAMIDVQHQNQTFDGISVVESFIARKNDPTFLPGAWVVGVHIPNDDIWGKVKKGEINGFSIEALVSKTPTQLEIEIPPVVRGLTTKAEDHDHEFFVTFDADGKFMGGRTSIIKGHFHTIRAGTVTDDEGGHNHKFSFVEGFNIPDLAVQKSDDDLDVSEEPPVVIMVLRRAGLTAGDDMSSPYSGTAMPVQISLVHDGLKESGFMPLTMPSAGETVYHHPTVGLLHVSEETGLGQDDPRKFSIRNLVGA